MKFIRNDNIYLERFKIPHKIVPHFTEPQEGAGLVSLLIPASLPRTGEVQTKDRMFQPSLLELRDKQRKGKTIRM